MMMKKMLSFGITLLLLSTCFLLVTTSTASFSYGNVITVDDEGDGDYTSIKEAVNNASEGDIIEVYSGTYYEHGIEIRKENITLKGIPYELGTGNDIGMPFLDGQDHDLLFIKADGVTLSGFRIENEGNVAAGTITLNSATNCLISENDVSHMLGPPIYCKDCSNIKIINNNLSHSAIRQGICFHECDSFTISRNIITNCPTGILVWDSNNNTIEGNTILNCGHGIESYGSFNIVFQNIIEDNSHGIVVVGAFNVIKQNNFIGNSKTDAFFQIGIDDFPFLNQWFNNYWGRPRILPYPIFGFVLFFIPWVQFDWRPALLPHDITSIDEKT